VSALLTVSQAAELLNVSEMRVYTLAREDLIPCVRLGRQVRFSPSALEAFIESGGRPLPGGWRREAEQEPAA